MQRSMCYPFFGLPAHHSILAFWYNVPKSSVAFAVEQLGEIQLGSSLQVY